MADNSGDHRGGVDDEQQLSTCSALMSAVSSLSVSTTGTSTPSSGTLPSTPGSAPPSPQRHMLETLDQSLRLTLGASRPFVLVPRASITRNESNGNPYARWECGFGFQGTVREPEMVPVTREAFLRVARTEVESIRHLHNGFTAYITAICSGEYHDFDQEFLSHQSHAAATTKTQLNQVAANIDAIIAAVGPETYNSFDGAVGAELIEAFRYAQLWTRRTRSVLVSAHVFYKINYVIGSEKKQPSSA